MTTKLHVRCTYYVSKQIFANLIPGMYFVHSNRATTVLLIAESFFRKPEHEKRKLTPREKRFIKFASTEYDGQVYMTPQDFLESVVEGEPRPRFKRRW